MLRMSSTKSRPVYRLWHEYQSSSLRNGQYQHWRTVLVCHCFFQVVMLKETLGRHKRETTPWLTQTKFCVFVILIFEA